MNKFVTLNELYTTLEELEIENINLRNRIIELQNDKLKLKVKLVNSITGITVKLKIEKLNRYQIVRLKAFRTKCTEILKIIDNDN